jgi:hypothetical protein
MLMFCGPGVGFGIPLSYEAAIDSAAIHFLHGDLFRHVTTLKNVGISAHRLNRSKLWFLSLLRGYFQLLRCTVYLRCIRGCTFGNGDKGSRSLSGNRK